MSIESVSPKIRQVVKDVVGVYVHHVKDKVKANDADYIRLGVDRELEDYKKVFDTIMSVWLLKRKKHKLNKRVVDETIGVLNKYVEDNNYTYFIDSFPKVILKTSKVVLEEIKKGVAENDRY